MRTVISLCYRVYMRDSKDSKKFFASVIRFDNESRVSGQGGQIILQKIRTIRIRKRAQMVAAEQPTAVEKEAGPKTEQKMRSIVAAWVRDHRQRSEELQRNLIAAFRKGLPLTSLAK